MANFCSLSCDLNFSGSDVASLLFMLQTNLVELKNMVVLALIFLESLFVFESN